jgi:Tfp pilus assembly protein PilN
MFTIDLLKGQGVPLKSSPVGLAIIAVTVAVPFIVAVIMFSLYLDDKASASVLKQEIARCEKEIDKLSDAVETYESLEKDKALYGSCLAEVKSSLGRYIQWSPVLVTMVKNLPESVVLTGLEVRKDTVRKKVPKAGNPDVMVEKNIPKKILLMNVSGNPKHNCGKAVMDFQDSLRSSDFLGPRLESIGFSQESETLKGQDVASYEIKCVFKETL